MKSQFQTGFGALFPSYNFCLLFSIVFLNLLTFSSPHFNVFLSREEVRRLFGVGTELYYVREGMLNTYALNFIVPIPANVTILNFNWQALMKRPMPYTAHVEYNNIEAMITPSLNISPRGFVPKTLSTFSLSLPCSGSLTAEVTVKLQLNVTALSRRNEKNVTSRRNEKNVTSLTFRRKKVCLLAEKFLPQAENKLLKSSSIFVAISIAVTVTVVVLTFAAFILIKIRKYRERKAQNCPYYSEASYLGVNSSNDSRVFKSASKSHRRRALSIKSSNSYATIASIKNFSLLGYSFNEQENETPKRSICGSEAPLYYASSPVSQHLYTNKILENCSPMHSVVNSGLSQKSWCSPRSLRSQRSWRDPRQEDPIDKLKKLTVDRWRVIVGETVQEGMFGRVHQGICHETDTKRSINVLLKTVSGDSSCSQSRLMVKEGMLFEGIDHANILSILGVVNTDSMRPILIYPHQDQVNLKLYLTAAQTYITENRPMKGKKLLTQDAIQMSLDALEGLIFLHKNKILHKDVATRNCMVEKDQNVQITDTALSRDIFPNDYHCIGDNENRPLKWLSTEAVLYKKYSVSSDVWMFGVLLWELVTSAKQPYAEVDPFEMGEYLRDGFRLPQPHSCPDDLFTIMAICWTPKPEDRPSLHALKSCLQEFHSALSSFV